MTVSLQHHDNVALIIVDNPPVNALSHAVRAGVVDKLAEIADDNTLTAAVLICAGRTFFAGADIREFGKPMLEPSLRDMLQRLDELPKMTIAAIHGSALGGGLETALCCNYRIISDQASVGLPESNLGLLPGAGGTQRLPRLAGAEKALDIMIHGKPVPAAVALALNIVDRVSEHESLQQAAIDYAQELLAAGLPPRRASELPPPAVAPGFFADYRKKIARRTRGYEAPERIIQCVEAATQLPFAEGMARERDLFIDCMNSPQSAAMRYLFFAERAAAKVPGISKDVTPRAIGSVGVIGAGTMGAGIALACMNAGLPVTLLDNDAASLLRGVETIEKLLDGMVSKGRIDATTSASRFELLHTASDYAALAESDLVIEAVFENMAIKEQVFAALDDACKPGAILATNTSTLDIDRIAAATARPADVIGLHFFSPANIMRLLEIVRGQRTSDEIIVSALRFARQINKLGVVVGNCFGFVGNRMLYGYGRESQLLLLEGAAPEQIDRALTNFGMAMGPNAVGDLAGLDVGYKVRQERTDLPDDPRYYRVADLLAEMGRYGQKTGAGTYRYETGSRTPLPDPVVTELIESEAARLGVTRREIGDGEIVERCIYALVIEGARLLEEKIAARPGDIDAIWANGYGFPRYRGGPMFHADTVGLAEVAGRIRLLAHEHGDTYWSVPPLLERLAADGRRFSDLQG